MKHEKDSTLVFLTHRSALIDYATPILGCRTEAEDVVQDAYLRFVSATEGKAISGVSIAHPVAYLYRTVRNLALNWLRTRLSEGGRATGGDLLEFLPSPSPTPEHEALYRDELRAVAEALAGLPERTRRAFELHRLRGHTLRQVADILGISIGLAHQLVRDALTCCAERLDNE